MSGLLDQVCEVEKQSWGLKRLVGAVFIVLAIEVGKGQRLQDCCPGVVARDSTRQVKKRSKTQRGQVAQHICASG